MAKTNIEVHLPELIPVSQLQEHPRNSNKQSRHMFGELRESIRENGFDETLTVVPNDENGYYIVAGNHRFRAGRAEGMKEFPCVVREDWNEVQTQVEMVRRNYVRGALDRDAFTLAVDALAAEQDISVDEIQEAMGFEDTDVFLDFYKEENEKREKAQQAAANHNSGKGKSSSIQMIDDLGLILSAIFEQHGDTVPYSFLVFPAGQRNHLFIAATPALVNNLSSIAEYCIVNKMDINVILGGLITIGMDQSKMFKKEEDTDLSKAKELGREGLDEDPRPEFEKIEA